MALGQVEQRKNCVHFPTGLNSAHWQYEHQYCTFLLIFICVRPMQTSKLTSEKFIEMGDGTNIRQAALLRTNGG